jgi:hypothetical protein
MMEGDISKKIQKVADMQPMKPLRLQDQRMLGYEFISTTLEKAELPYPFW